jgi:hypothetical protein
MYANNQLLFPVQLIPKLRDLRGPVWQSLVDRVLEKIDLVGETGEDCLALSLTMIRVNGCVPCETDSYRAMRGCEACTLQTLRRYKGTDEELVALYQQALDDVRRYLTRTGKGSSVRVG